MAVKITKRVSSKPVLIEGKHPLVKLRETLPVDLLFRSLGHANHTTVSVYASRAKKKKALVVPAEWCLPLSRLSGISPHTFRPDLYLADWQVASEPVAVSPPKPRKARTKARAVPADAHLTEGALA